MPVNAHSNLSLTEALQQLRAAAQTPFEQATPIPPALHHALAVPTMQRPSQTLIDWVADDLLINSEWQIVHGVVHPVYKPGLGVELNRAALEQYATGS